MTRDDGQTERSAPAEWRDPSYLVGTIGIPCLGFALLRLLLILYDRGSVFAAAYVPFVAGQMCRGVTPLVILALIAGVRMTSSLYKKTLVPAATIAALFSALTFLPAVCSSIELLTLVRGLAQAGSAWLYVCWGEAYARTHMRDVAVSMTLSMIVTSVLAAGLTLLPDIGRAIVAGLIPVFTTWLFFMYMHRDYPSKPYRTASSGGAGAVSLGSYGLWLLALGAFSVVMGVVHGYSRLVPEGDGAGYPFALYIAFSLALSVVLLIGVFVRDGAFSLPAIWTIFVVLCAASLALAFVVPDMQPASLALFGAIRYVALAFVNIKLVDIARHSSTPLYAIFAAGWAIVTILMTLGMSLQVSIASLGVFTVGVPVVAFVGIVLTGAVFIFNGSRLSDVIAPEVQDGRSSASATQTISQIQYRQCQSLRQRYGLTDRETEVAFLIVQGYTQQYCADALMVSLNTVRTHMKRIYAKLDIHTKDELLARLAEQGGDLLA